MPWEITYTDKWSGTKQTMIHTHNQSNAVGHAENLAKENNCKATCEYVETGPHTDNSGTRTHIVSFGNDKK